MAERLYYGDSFLKSFEAQVVDIREHARRDGVSEWHIALDRTAFYPASGGQPHDTGVLTATARSGATLDVAVFSVSEDDAGEVWHATSKPLLAGTPVSGAVDWARRLDHMQQHSGQHLLSAICAREYGASTTSFHLGEELSTIDLATASLSPEQVERIEHLANLSIAEDLAVSSRTVDAAEAVSLLAAGYLRKLPEREGSIRLIEMPGIDLNACGGTHVRSLGQIGGMLLRSTEKVKQGVRLSFACGLRAVRCARLDDQVLAKLAQGLSIQRGDLPQTIERKQSELKAAAKERQRLYEELAGYHAARLLVEEPIENGMRIVQRSFTERDAAYIKLLASLLVSAAPRTMALLASTQQEPAALVCARSGDLVQVHSGEWLAAAVAAHGSRGGGSPGMAQGQIAATAVPAVFDTLRARARAAAVAD